MQTHGYAETQTKTHMAVFHSLKFQLLELHKNGILPMLSFIYNLFMYIIPFLFVLFEIVSEVFGNYDMPYGWKREHSYRMKNMKLSNGQTGAKEIMTSGNKKEW